MGCFVGLPPFLPLSPHCKLVYREKKVGVFLYENAYKLAILLCVVDGLYIWIFKVFLEGV